MKRFDIAIKVMQDEIYRVVGKVASDAADKGYNPSYAVKIQKAKHLKEAINILLKHERNKGV